jgi:hypothetical protein
MKPKPKQGDRANQFSMEYAFRPRSAKASGRAVQPLPRRRITTGAVSLDMGGDLHRSTLGRTAAIELAG